MKLLLVLSVAVLMMGCAEISPIKSNIPSKKLYLEDRGLILQLIEKSNENILENGIAYNRIENIRSNLCSSSSIKSCPYVTVINSNCRESPYATMSTIIIAKPVIDAIKNDDDLAFIVGHEMSHILLGHTAYKDSRSINFLKKKLKKSKIKPLNTPASLIAITGLDELELSALGSIIFSDEKLATATVLGLGVYSLLSHMKPKVEKSLYKIDRKMEFSADKNSISLMSKANYDVMGSIRIIKKTKTIFNNNCVKMKKENPKKNGAVKRYIKTLFPTYDIQIERTHPNNSKRLKKLSKAIKEII